ncbi:MAG: aminotransferase class I/II-fold pyridoxal phosphate-dependent enzyme [Haliscomenobacter sp.]|nr:aminotransferase class I/II-fold pyridoxal phosphate-dependent enzyme [Haliscomenobacter sp.]MBK8879503.1 aminotransferase class I/II-fold pyridoxal phosphate-dependent enzyme [Haliscomenobacter sp.]
MNHADFRHWAHELADWMADYFEQVGQYPVKPPVLPGDIKNQLPTGPPASGEAFEQQYADFQQIILPGMTHWQHPQFFGYFPASRSMPSVLGEMLTAAMGAQCMIWYTSPAAEELEERMMEWLRDMLALPGGWTGVIQETASAATLVALLMARERASSFGVNQTGFYGRQPMRVYASEQVHSSIPKAVKIAGLGEAHLVYIPTDASFAMDPGQLEAAILKDLEVGFQPVCVVAAIGTTSSTAIDPIKPIGEICRKYGIFLHVDAAYAGTALLLPEMRWMSEGLELADSFVFNPHKWMFTNFDCTAFFVRDKQLLTNTFSILPEYLKTPLDKQVNNYRDWGIQLGRRFRALKLWFVIRTYGVAGLRARIREHIRIGQWLAETIRQQPDFELLAPVPLNLVCFRYRPEGMADEGQLNSINERLLQTLNDSGKILLTQTKLNGKYTIRLVAGQVDTTQETVNQGWELIRDTARAMAI